MKLRARTQELNELAQVAEQFLAGVKKGQTELVQRTQAYKMQSDQRIIALLLKETMLKKETSKMEEEVVAVRQELQEYAKNLQFTEIEY